MHVGILFPTLTSLYCAACYSSTAVMFYFAQALFHLTSLLPFCNIVAATVYAAYR